MFRVARRKQIAQPLADPFEIAGQIAQGRPFAGVPVTAGLMDAWASMFGLGVAGEGQAMYLSGTSEVLGLISQSGSGVAGVACGLMPDLESATRALVAIVRVFEPEPDAAALAEDRFAAYQELYRSMGPVNRQLNPTQSTNAT